MSIRLSLVFILLLALVSGSMAAAHAASDNATVPESIAGGVMGWAHNMLYRSLLDFLGHGCFTAATGAFVGFFKARQPAGGFAVKGFLLGLPVAMVLHGSFNLLDVAGSIVPAAFGVLLPLFDPVLTLVIFIFYIILGVYLQMRNKRTGQGTG